jgi:alkanesulfonate monooxygenase SsuD/methylene tetrahydromethanopterin reductase-like flavin-dependent oxidoreductase (luciferase family)
VGADAATLDVLSEGRLDLGLSRGSMDDAPHRNFNAPRDEARLRFDEAFEVLRLFLRGRPFSFTGNFYDLRDVVPAPVCSQRPHPPIYMVANNPRSLDSAAAAGLPVFMNGAMRVPELREALTRYRMGAEAAGFDPYAVDIPVNRFVFVGETRAHATKVMREPFLQFLENRAPDLRAYLAGRFGDRARSFDFLADEIAIFDDPEGCAARLMELRERLGIRHVLCTFNLITLDHRQAVESMRRFARDVVPLIERAPRSVRSLPPESMIRAVGDGARLAEPQLTLRAG